MEKPAILVADADAKNGEIICHLIRQFDFEADYAASIDELARVLDSGTYAAVLLNLDTLPTYNQFFKKLKNDHGGLHIWGFSERSWHPELAEALGSSISACLRDPIDLDELTHCLKGLSRGTNQPEKPAFSMTTTNNGTT